MERNNKIAIKKPGVKDEKKERPKTNKDFFDKVGRSTRKGYKNMKK